MRAFLAPFCRSCKGVNAEAWKRKEADISRLSSTFNLFPFTHKHAQVRTKYKLQVPPELPPALNAHCSDKLAFIPTTTRHAGATNTDTALTDVAQREATWLSKNVSPRVDPLKNHPPSISRVALYARVSTSNGHQDPEMQLSELREYADRRGWEIIDGQLPASVRIRHARDRIPILAAG
jgi:hypothetical protein